MIPDMVICHSNLFIFYSVFYSSFMMNLVKRAKNISKAFKRLIQEEYKSLVRPFELHATGSFEFGFLQHTEA